MPSVLSKHTIEFFSKNLFKNINSTLHFLVPYCDVFSLIELKLSHIYNCSRFIVFLHSLEYKVQENIFSFLFLGFMYHQFLQQYITESVSLFLFFSLSHPTPSLPPSSFVPPFLSLSFSTYHELQS